LCLKIKIKGRCRCRAKASRLKPVLQSEPISLNARAAFSGTGFSREGASPGADSIADQPHFLWERACSRMLYLKLISDRSHAPGGNAAPDALRPAGDAHSSLGKLTRSVINSVTTRSVGTIIDETAPTKSQAQKKRP